MTRAVLPRGFNAWVATSVGSELGSGILAFGLTWESSGYGPGLAAGVLTLSVAPSVLLGLVGGAVADGFGPRKVMIAATFALMGISGCLGLSVLIWGATPAVLLIAAVLIGTVAAFHRPAVGVFPRLFVEDRNLCAAMARAGIAGQIARTAAPPLGGVLIGVVALDGIALLDVIGCALMAVVLFVIRPPLEHAGSGEAVSLRGIIHGVAAVRRTAGAPALLICVAIVAGAVIPAVALGIPLAARERGWSASQAGLIEAGWIFGGILAGSWFAWRGTASNARRPMIIGPLVAAGGLALFAGSVNWVAAVTSTILVGIGVVVLTAHLFPKYVALAPPAMMSRFQSLLILVQLAPQLIINPLIGLAVDVFGTGPVLVASGVMSLCASFVVARDRALR